jgi:ParB-like chromosome segregation protein Spo0J
MTEESFDPIHDPAPVSLGHREGLEYHPLANVFPLLEGDQFRELVDDIRANGIHEPIVLFEGKILDGRNRYRACLQAAVEPKYKTFEGSNPLKYVISLNLRRRHLNESQRAMVAARIANLSRGRPSSENRSIDTFSQHEAAALMNVSLPSVKRASKVLNEGPEELIQKIDSGEARVGACVRGQENLRQLSYEQFEEARQEGQRRKALIHEAQAPQMAEMTQIGSEPKPTHEQFEAALAFIESAMRDIKRIESEFHDEVHLCDLLRQVRGELMRIENTIGCKPAFNADLRENKTTDMCACRLCREALPGRSPIPTDIRRTAAQRGR